MYLPNLSVNLNLLQRIKHSFMRSYCSSTFSTQSINSWETLFRSI